MDAAQLAPSAAVDVQALDVDYLALSCHKLLAPYGVGVLYGREHLLAGSLPFLYGGDMIAEGKVAPDQVEYNELPWKYAAGTPNILGVIASAQTLRLVVDLLASGDSPRWFDSPDPLPREPVVQAMGLVARHVAEITSRALRAVQDLPEVTVYGPPLGTPRAPVLAFRVDGADPVDVARRLDDLGVESRAGCHCATLAHRDLGVDPPASCRFSFAMYTSPDDVEQAVDALGTVVRHARRGR